MSFAVRGALAIGMAFVSVGLAKGLGFSTEAQLFSTLTLVYYLVIKEIWEDR